MKELCKINLLASMDLQGLKCWIKHKSKAIKWCVNVGKQNKLVCGWNDRKYESSVDKELLKFKNYQNLMILLDLQ